MLKREMKYKQAEVLGEGKPSRKRPSGEKLSNRELSRLRTLTQSYNPGALMDDMDFDYFVDFWE